MKILLDQNTPLSLKPKFELNIQLTNPLLTDQGSMSLPMTLPRAPENLKNLGFPNRYDRYYKLRKKIPVVIQANIMQKLATLEIISSQGEDGIESVILLNEAQMYTKMQEVSMSSAFQIVRKASTFSIPGLSIKDPMDRMIKYMELVMLDQISDDFYLFPVATGHYTYTYTIGREPSKQTRETKIYELLNEQVSSGNRSNFDHLLDTDLQGNKYLYFRGRKAHILKEGNEECEVPKGYGITPFLKESYVIRRIFKYFGYELQPSFFDKDPDFASEVLINNTADALVKEQVDYSQLVPTCTIHEYLETVRSRFGCEFFVSEDHKTVIPIFWKDILKSIPKKDFSDKVNGEPVIEYSTPKQLKLCYKREIEFSDTVVDTYEKFERDYGKIIAYLDTIPDARGGGDNYDDGYYFIKDVCAIYEKYTYWIEDDAPREGKSWRHVVKAMFDYYLEGEDVEYEEHSSNIQYVPIVQGWILYSEGGGVYSTDFGRYRTFPFIGERRHMNTALKTTVTDEEGNTTSTEKNDDPGSCSIMAAFYRKVTSEKGFAVSHRAMGTMHRYDYEGKAVGNLDLTFGGEYGLYQRFWKGYDEVLKHSFHKIIFDLTLSELDIESFRMDELIRMDGQILLPELLEYTISKNGIKANSAEFRTIRLYKDLPR